MKKLFLNYLLLSIVIALSNYSHSAIASTAEHLTPRVKKVILPNTIHQLSWDPQASLLAVHILSEEGLIGNNLLLLEGGERQLPLDIPPLPFDVISKIIWNSEGSLLIVAGTTKVDNNLSLIHI